MLQYQYPCYTPLTSISTIYAISHLKISVLNLYCVPSPKWNTMKRKRFRDKRGKPEESFNTSHNNNNNNNNLNFYDSKETKRIQKQNKLVDTK